MLENFKESSFYTSDFSHKTNNKYIEFDLDNPETDYETEYTHYRTGRNDSEEKNRLLESYFHDLLGFSLLNAEDEKRYSAIMKLCRKKIGKTHNGSINTNNDSKINEILERLYKKKLDEKKYNFVRSNLRFVINVSKKFTGRGLAFADLIQEGNLGLIKAVEKFDYRKGFRFTTYASWWIKQSITRAVMKKSNTVAVPVYLQEQKNKVLKSRYKLKDELNREPTLSEISEESEVSTYAVDKIVRGFGTHSLDNNVSASDATTYKDVLPDEESPGQEEILSVCDLRDVLSLSLRALDEKEEEIIRLRYGVGIESIYTLQEISEKYNLSQERIRQIEKEALKKIALSEDGKILKSYIQG